MKKFLVTVLMVSLLSMTGCWCEFWGGDDCKCNETAHIKVENRSSHTTYDIILDGSRIGAISPGHNIEQDISAGESHTLEWKFANTGATACRSNPNLAKCSSHVFSCSNDL